MNHKTLSQIIALCGLLLTQSVGIAGAVQPEPRGSGAQPRSVQLTSRIELERLVDLAAQVNRVEIEYPTNVFRGKSITLRLTHELNPQQLWELCLSSLHKEGYTIIRQDEARGLYAVKSMQDAAADALPSERLETSGLMPGYQAVIVPVSRLQPQAMADRVSSMVTTSNKLQIEVIEGMDGLLVRGVVERLGVVLNLIRSIENDTAQTEIAVIEVTSRTAIEVVADVKTIISALETQGADAPSSSLIASPDGQSVRVYGPVDEQERVRSLIREADRRAALQTRILDPRGYPLDTVARFVENMARDESARGSGEAWRLVQDELTNTLIVTGTPAELEVVEDALARLADVSANPQRVIRMIKVHNREASRVREIVAQLLAARVLCGSDQGGGSRTDTLPAADGASQPRTGAAASDQTNSGSREDLELAVDDELNVIIATGSPRRIEQVEQLVLELDVRQPQVQLEVVMLSLSESETRDLGVELAGNIDTGDTLFGLGSLFGLSSVSPSSGSAQASGNGGSVVILSPGDFSAVIRAIETVNDGRSLSMPSIVVNNNQSATLNSTTTQPYLTTTITDSNITTSRGGSASAGTTINVSPQIAAGDHIVLDYSFTLSSFVGESSSAGVEPPTQQTSLNSIATIPDGYTIALGGIDSSSIGDSLSKTPGLADLPLIGDLFKSRSDSTSRSRFYVFIRATVMRSPSFEYLKFISEDLAKELQIDDGWPEVEPRIIK